MGEKIKKRKKTYVRLYTHRAYGCIIGDVEKKNSHLAEVSDYCVLNYKSKEESISVREEYLSSLDISDMGGIGKLMMSCC